MSENIFDIIVIVILAFSAFQGFKKGIISAAASLVALLLGVWGAIKFSSLTGEYLSDLISVSEKQMSLIAFAVTFVLIVVGVHFVAKTVEKFVETIALGMVNKVFGSAFGVLKMAFIISVVLFILNEANARFGFMNSEFKRNSLFYKPIEGVAPMVFKYLDFEEIQNEVEKRTDAINI